MMHGRKMPSLTKVDIILGALFQAPIINKLSTYLTFTMLSDIMVPEYELPPLDDSDSKFQTILHALFNKPNYLALK